MFVIRRGVCFAGLCAGGAMRRGAAGVWVGMVAELKWFAGLPYLLGLCRNESKEKLGEKKKRKKKRKV